MEKYPKLRFGFPNLFKEIVNFLWGFEEHETRLDIGDPVAIICPTETAALTLITDFVAWQRSHSDRDGEAHIHEILTKPPQKFSEDRWSVVFWLPEPEITPEMERRFEQIVQHFMSQEPNEKKALIKPKSPRRVM